MINKRGALIDAILWVIISFIIIVFLALMVFVWGATYNAFSALEDTPGLNITYPVQVTFGVAYPAIASSLKWWSFMMIFAYAISLFISNFLARKVHPAAGVVAYLFTTAIALVLAVYLSNTYQDLLNNTVIGETLSGFTGSTFIMLYLPIWSTVIGFVGLFFLVVGIIRDAQTGGGLR